MEQTSLPALLRVEPGTPVDLAAIDTRATPGLPDDKAVRRDPKGWSRDDAARIGAGSAAFQEMLYASAKRGGDRRRLLMVLQAMDCGGKDGTVTHVAGALNPLGLKIVSFGAPTAEERRHGFLWRIRRQVPAPGYVGVF